MPEDPLLPPPRPVGLEDLHAGLHDVLRLIEIEHVCSKGGWRAFARIRKARACWKA
ncbi:hypothetical protein B932_0564 [Gluconobacter oxydans H24]|uniref:hypothetical protein n=1 Tax=Gluconobacter thailandicus TaxID=257438 RepID=UPI0002998F0A|nr:hypothetical protein [Gluconobacter thailandicus]AFW00170.1 hypothetical protein B932_0564 [Gluconobacter oxydans H24]